MSGPANHLLIGLALRRLAENYALAVDSVDAALFAEQFAEDGVLIAPRGSFGGRQSLASVPPMMRERYERTFHAVFNQVAVIDGDRASAQTYCIARHFFHDSANRHLCHEMTIRYQDEFASIGDVWKFSRRELIVDASHTFTIDN